MDVDKLKTIHNLLINTIEEIAVENPRAKEELKNIKEFKNFRNALSQESDRGSALMAAAFIETKIAQLLQSFFIDNKNIYKRLFENNGALATFSSKIDLAFLLGLIPKNIFDDLHLLRKIRNDFAHNASLITFESNPTKEHCYSFQVLVKVQLRKHPRAYFLRAMTLILVSINRQTNNLQKCTIAQNFDITAIQEAMQKVENHIQ